MMALFLTILFALALFSLFSKTISRSILTLPIVFTTLGFALSDPLHAAIHDSLLHEGKKVLAELTLILVLFSDASHVRVNLLAKDWRIPARMLGFGLPLTILLGTAIVYWLNPMSGVAMALLTAAVLTPTDAALGQAVVSSPAVPNHLAQTINIESGLNDGLVLPFVLLGAILASSVGAVTNTQDVALEAVREVILGPLAGIAIGWAAARAMDWAQNHETMDEAAGAVVFLVTALAAYGGAVAIGGNGFIAAFVAGMVFGNAYRHDIHFIREFMEGTGQLLVMLSFLMFGAFLLPDGLVHSGPKTGVLALLFLTVVRVLPIVLSLAGSGLPAREKLFLGWFGPRGLASVLFTLLMMDQFDFPNEEELLACVSLTVGLSILLHGLSATPLAQRIGRPRA